METFGIDSETLSYFPSEFQRGTDSVWVVGLDWLSKQTLFPDTMNPKRTIVIGSEISEIQVLGLLLNQGVSHVLQSQKEELSRELSVAWKMITRPKEILKDPNSILFPDEVIHHFRIEFSSSKEKSEVLRQLEEYLRGIRGTASILDAMLTQANELIMNSVFSAPIDAQNEHIHQLVDRTSAVEFGMNKKASLFVCASEKRLLLGCEDPFGSLEIDRVLAKIQQCCEHGITESVNFGAGGAGVGSYMIFQRSKSYFLMVEPGVKTVLCSLFPLGLSFKMLEKRSRNVHLLLHLA